ncbi:hypothetical protein [Clostridium sp.]|uniref:hypothetical protein n=1 Tax=Clostridium sp. TaxID=1506 RepID=UPI002622B549|nr:hypothetical protein [Clostridium sp.]
MASKVIDTILNLKDNFSKVINQTTNNTKKFQRQIKMAENQAKQMRESVSGAFNSTAMKIAGVIGAVGLTEFAKSSLELASNLAEVQNVVDTTFKDGANTINDFAKTTSQQFGISELQAKKYAGTLGAMLKSAGFTGDELSNMSTNLTGLAGDLASFYNLDPDEAFDKIKSGISGMTEPLRSLGVDVSETTISTYALANGFNKQWKDATQAEKEMWRYKSIMSQTKDAQGDYAKTADSFANALRTLKLNIQTFGASIMSYAIPSFQSLFGNINNFIKSIDIKDVMENKVIPTFREIGKVIDTLKDNMKTIIPIISGVVGGLVGFMVIGKVTSEVRNFLKVINNISKLTNPFYIIALGIGLLITGFVNAYNTSDDFRERVNNLFDKLMGFGDYAGSKLPDLLDNLTNVFQNDLQPALDEISKVSVDIFDFISNNWSTIKPIVEGIVGALGAYKLALIAIQINTKIVSVVTSAWSAIELIIWGIVNATSAWEAAQFALNVLMDANPVGIVCLAIAALGTAIYEIITHWKEICTWVGNTWNSLKDNPIAEFIALCNPFTALLFEITKHFDDIASAISKAYHWLTDWNGTDAKDKDLNVTEHRQSVTDGAAVTVTSKDNSSSDNGDFGANATGTQYWKGGATKINEFGGEMAVLPSGSKVIPADKTDKLLSNNNKGVIINLNISGNVIGNEDFKNEVGQHIFNQVKLAMTNS